MTFLHVGLAIAGAAAVAAPIIIHLLFRRRKQPVRWGAMRFLLEAYRKAQRRLRLEQWLLLATRCLLVALIGLALARPILSSASVPLTGGGRLVYLVIDNGLASSVTGTDGAATALDRHKALAAEIIEGLGPSDRVALVTAARPATGVVVPPSADHGAVRRALEAVEVSQTPTDLPEALERLATSLEAESSDWTSAAVYVLSDFFSGSADLDEPLEALPSGDGRRITLLASPPRSPSVDNVQVVGVDPLRRVVLRQGDDAGAVRVTLRRLGATDGGQMTVVRLAAGDRPVGEATLRWEPGQADASVWVSVSMDAVELGPVALSASIDRDALMADDRRLTVLDVRDRIRVGVLDRREFGSSARLDTFGTGAWIRRAMQPGEKAPVETVDLDPAAIDAAGLRGMDVAVLARPDLVTDAGWQALSDYVGRGGVVWLFPPPSGQTMGWAETARQALRLDWRFAAETVTAPDEEAGLAFAPEQPESALLAVLSTELRDLLRPVRVIRQLPIESGLGSGEEVLRLDDGTAFLAVTAPRAAASTDGSAERQSVDESTGASRAPGLVIYTASALQLDWTSLPAKPLMVALTHEVVRESLGERIRRQRLVVGDRPALPVPASARRLEGPDGRALVLELEDGMVRPEAPLPVAGVYHAVDPSGRALVALPVNVDVEAARTEGQGRAAVEAWLGQAGSWTWMDPASPGAELHVASSGSEISRWLLLFVAALAVIETALARRFSHAERESRPSTGAAPELALGGGAA